MKLEEIEKLCEQATIGPWRWDENGKVLLTGLCTLICERSDEEKFPCEDMEFIAASRTLMPKLIEFAMKIKKQREIRMELKHNKTKILLDEWLEELETE